MYNCTVHCVQCPLDVHHAASVSGNARVARVLIEHGADVNRPNSTGQTPLILAAVGGHDALARVLLEAGADPRAVNNHRQTPLDIARAMEKTVSSYFDC